MEDTDGSIGINPAGECVDGRGWLPDEDRPPASFQGGRRIRPCYAASPVHTYALRVSRNCVVSCLLSGVRCRANVRKRPK